MLIAIAAFLKPAKDRNAASPETNANKLLWISTLQQGQETDKQKLILEATESFLSIN